ncbi:MAG: cyclic nucleotide-binding domain-containing protein [Deltaproteobacteria bacterium]|jgi:serine/threonine protein phosphatase PrpC|nr:cyclic nucleotide-binding domain-containing protein [Deltaproteobacteria bacterium]MBW2534508.1 cyclic nucleotide-binding domain-containing protein [Deltaproteobacteria bacterium]
MPLSDDIRLFATSDVGRRRPHNEDSFLLDDGLGLCIVADGMGGHAAGEIASATAVEFIHNELMRNRSALRGRALRGPQSGVTIRQILALLEAAVQTASSRIYALAQTDARKRGMGTTLSLLMVLDSLAYIAHVGDSRIYLIREGSLRQLTEDHTMAAEMVRLGMVTPDRVHKVPHQNAITRAVGIHPSVNVDTFTLEVLPGDQLLLATDGLTGYLRKDQDLLERAEQENGDRVVQQLVDFANEGGGKDNITVVLMRVGAADTDDGTRARRLALKREVLAQLPLFCRLQERELESLMQVVDVAEYAEGEEIVREGEAGDELFVVLSGRLQVARGATSIGELGPGEPFGEMALIRTASRSATVTAVEPSELLTLRRRDFFEVIRAEPEISVKLLWQFVLVLADRLEQTSEDLRQARDALAGYDAAENVISLVEIPADSEAASTRRTDLEADPFSAPMPASLGSFRLGYVPDPRDSAPGPPVTVPEAPAAKDRPSGETAAAHAEDDPEDPDPPTLRGGMREHPAASARDTARSAGTDPPPPKDEPGDDLRATVPFVRGEPGKSGQPGAGGSGTVPLQQLDGIRSEIDQLRQEFKERLRKSRDGRGEDKSD